MKVHVFRRASGDGKRCRKMPRARLGVGKRGGVLGNSQAMERGTGDRLRPIRTDRKASPDTYRGRLSHVRPSLLHPRGFFRNSASQGVSTEVASLLLPRTAQPGTAKDYEFSQNQRGIRSVRVLSELREKPRHHRPCARRPQVPRIPEEGRARGSAPPMK